MGSHSSSGTSQFTAAALELPLAPAGACLLLSESAPQAMRDIAHANTQTSFSWCTNISLPTLCHSSAAAQLELERHDAAQCCDLWQIQCDAVCCRHVLPTVAVQIAPADPAPALEERLLSACSAGLERARCVSARNIAAAPQAIAVVSWINPAHVSIEVGFAKTDVAEWLSRDLDFAATDPEIERWRAVGFTIALLVDDERFWSALPPESPAADVAPVNVTPEIPVAPGAPGPPTPLELRALGGAGLVRGPWRWGGGVRLSVPFSRLAFATGSANYALASDAALDMRWFDASLGVGLFADSLWRDVDGRVRLELLAENVAASVRRDALTDRSNVWVPGVSVGGDLLWEFAAPWLLSLSADAFWLDGSTPITSAGQRLGTSAGAGVTLGLGAGYQF
jgi:hypothetical protein